MPLANTVEADRLGGGDYDEVRIEDEEAGSRSQKPSEFPMGYDRLWTWTSRDVERLRIEMLFSPSFLTVTEIVLRQA